MGRCIKYLILLLVLPVFGFSQLVIKKQKMGADTFYVLNTATNTPRYYFPLLAGTEGQTIIFHTGGFTTWGSISITSKQDYSDTTTYDATRSWVKYWLSLQAYLTAETDPLSPHLADSNKYGGYLTKTGANLLYALSIHSHNQSSIIALSDSLLDRFTKSQANSRYSLLGHTHIQSDISGLVDSLSATVKKKDSATVDNKHSRWMTYDFGNTLWSHTSLGGYGITDAVAKLDSSINGGYAAYFDMMTKLALKADVNANTTGTAGGLSGSALGGDVTNSGNTVTVVGINGTNLAGLATGIVKNTTGTGVPSIAGQTGTGNIVMDASPSIANASLTYTTDISGSSKLKNPNIYEYNWGNSGTAMSITTVSGGAYYIIRNANTTITITPPIYADHTCRLTLFFKHEASATAYAVTYSPVPLAAGGTLPTYTNTSGAYDIVSLIWEPINAKWFIMGNTDFK